MVPQRRSRVRARAVVPRSGLGVVVVCVLGSVLGIALGGVLAAGLTAAGPPAAVTYAALGVAAVGLAAVVASRAYAALAGRRVGLERVYALADALAAASKTGDGVIVALLTRTRTLLECDRVEIVLTQGEGEAAQRWWLEHTGPVRSSRERPEVATRPFGSPLTGRLVVRADDAPERAALTDLGLRAAVLVPVRVDDGVEGHLLAGYRTGSRAGSRAGSSHRRGQPNERLLQMIASQAGVALRTHRLLARLHDDANTDELTRLPNRKSFRHVLDEAARTCTQATQCSVMVIDFDGFKAVNDTLGHQAGDELLVQIGGRLRAAIGDDGVLARLGGDEFAALSTRCRTDAEAIALAERLLTAFESPVQVGGSRLRVGGSLGIAVGPRDGQTGSALLRCADIAMYAAKRAGGGLRSYSAAMDVGKAESVTLAGDLRDAIAAGVIDVQVLPVIWLATGQVHSVEVLARWTHPELGPVSPETFFTAAARSGQTSALSGLVLARALARARDWLRCGIGVRVAVNTAPRWLADPGLAAQIEDALTEHGVPADRLCLEFAESSVLADPQAAIANLERLAALGVQLCLDDFGTGMSSLTYLARLPVTLLKIDQWFVGRLGAGERDRAITQSILDLSRSLGIEAVAEGVGDAVTAQNLLEMGCDLAQGYLFGRPVDPAALAGYIAEHGYWEGSRPGEALVATPGGRLALPALPTQPALTTLPSPRSSSADAERAGGGDRPDSTPVLP